MQDWKAGHLRITAVMPAFSFARIVIEPRCLDQIPSSAPNGSGDCLGVPMHRLFAFCFNHDARQRLRPAVANHHAS